MTEELRTGFARRKDPWLSEELLFEDLFEDWLLFSLQTSQQQCGKSIRFAKRCARLSSIGTEKRIHFFLGVA